MKGLMIFWPDDGWKSGGGPPQSRTLARIVAVPDNAKRLGVRQSSGAFGWAMQSISELMIFWPDEPGWLRSCAGVRPRRATLG